MSDQPAIDRRRFVIASVVVVGLMLLVSTWAWGQLPPGASVPIHWDAEGRPNGFAPKEIALLISPLIGVLVTLLFWAIPSIEPRRQNLLRSATAYGATWLAVLLLVLVVHIVTTLAMLGSTIDVGVWVLTAIGLLFVVLGAVLGRVRSNFLFGIRTPWTLSSERSWERTHRVGGPAFMAFGAALALVGLFKLGSAWLLVMFAAGIAMVVALVAYSYVVWRSDADRSPIGR